MQIYDTNYLANKAIKMIDLKRVKPQDVYSLIYSHRDFPIRDRSAWEFISRHKSPFLIDWKTSTTRVKQKL